eukprot:CAMPEP_0194398470 /NCGR_PEP_ID=MMETSP0174-20130528/126120_1 /TAXON_ID=216777 /ORGANISM="Proboscia alata, Strain PI-D3" /LENGTH=488 /DNA_ID=CAMNT_0039194767 /DNA_START=40 /DNA_END=1508 /DNA_ORIENTATION=-
MRRRDANNKVSGEKGEEQHRKDKTSSSTSKGANSAQNKRALNVIDPKNELHPSGGIDSCTSPVDERTDTNAVSPKIPISRLPQLHLNDQFEKNGYAKKKIRGVLLKRRNHFRKHWRRRYFVLEMNTGLISYYLVSDATEPLSSPHSSGSSARASYFTDSVAGSSSVHLMKKRHRLIIGHDTRGTLQLTSQHKVIIYESNDNNNGSLSDSQKQIINSQHKVIIYESNDNNNGSLSDSQKHNHKFYPFTIFLDTCATFVSIIPGIESSATSETKTSTWNLAAGSERERSIWVAGIENFCNQNNSLPKDDTTLLHKLENTDIGIPAAVTSPGSSTMSLFQRLSTTITSNDSIGGGSRSTLATSTRDILSPQAFGMVSPISHKTTDPTEVSLSSDAGRKVSLNRGLSTISVEVHGKQHEPEIYVSSRGFMVFAAIIVPLTGSVLLFIPLPQSLVQTTMLECFHFAIFFYLSRLMYSWYGEDFSVSHFFNNRS